MKQNQNGVDQDVREGIKRFEKIAEMGDDGIIVFDEGYRIEFANTVASELTGYSKERLMGKDVRHLLTERDIGYLDKMHSDVGADQSAGRSERPLAIRRGETRTPQRVT